MGEPRWGRNESERLLGVVGVQKVFGGFTAVPQGLLFRLLVSYLPSTGVYEWNRGYLGVLGGSM